MKFVSFGIFLSALLLSGADPSWRAKPVPSWTADEAKQFLADSPWAKNVVPGLIPELSPQQRREGGAVGGGKGAGFAELKGNIFTPEDPSVRAQKQRAQARNIGRLTLRWESAFPVRAAELKAQDLGVADLDGEAYAIAVYGVLNPRGNQKELRGELKKAAFLKRDGKKHTKPFDVEIYPQSNGLTMVLYLFSRHDEITTEDERIEFSAQIDRLAVTADFLPAQMMFEGKLQL